jgi:hypothetical protein
MDEHCKEHEERTICIVKIKKDLEAIKNAGHSRLKQLSNEVDQIWDELKTKLGAKSFAWVVGGLVFIMTLVLGVQWSLLFGINEKVHYIEIAQAEITVKLEIEDKVKARMKE